jgi:uncharacterized protein (TIGR03435 family)
MDVPAITFTVVQVAEPFYETPAMVPSTRSHGDWIPIAVLSLWACGFAGIVLMRLRGWLRVRAAVRSSIPMDIPFPVPVRSSAALLQPGVVGFFRPILLCPAGIVERLTPSQLQAVFAHELCHVQRRDNLTAAVHMIVEAVFWFHPLVWWISARLMEERERACDEGVLELGSERHLYAESILKTCQFCAESPLACVSGVTGADLKKRIVRIMTERLANRLSFGRKLLLAALGITVIAGPMVFGLVCAPQVRAQAAQTIGEPSPSFEVATIKPNHSVGQQMSAGFQPGRFTASATTIKRLIAFAYHVKPFQVLGGPSWMSSDKFDIEAKEPDALAEELQKLRTDQAREKMGLLLQSLFADRFGLKVSHDTKELPVYALVVAKGGPKLQEEKPGATNPNVIKDPEGHVVGRDSISVATGHIAGPGLPMGTLVMLLSFQLNRTVLDQTGLKGKYDVTLQWTPDDGTAAMPAGLEGSSPGAAPPPDSSGPSIFTAIQEQLGLKLESTKGPVEVLVIDHIERPSEN